MTRDDIHNKLMLTFQAMQKQGYEFTNGFAIDFEANLLERFQFESTGKEASDKLYSQFEGLEDTAKEPIRETALGYARARPWLTLRETIVLAMRDHSELKLSDTELLFHY